MSCDVFTSKSLTGSSITNTAGLETIALAMDKSLRSVEPKSLINLFYL